MAPEKALEEWWRIVVPLVVAAVIGVALGCWVSSDLPLGCAILLSPLIPTTLWFTFGVLMAAWSRDEFFSRPYVWMWVWPLIAFLLSTPTAGVFILTRWLVKGRV
ncbi:hypothetical protein DES53_102759 [Roseimicrobium gellanilyticum]|uniref:Uncharacterized protein n=2 Tax=Roseimicrobium gellanilyticum TaxID=748857 RepID=A0A366HTE6_9BACT|nr:hypothetical protein DES53_102759 [Roseimicrobium gellanilyticum]